MWTALLAAGLFAQETDTIKVDVRLVRVAASVTRANGSFVAGLEQKDFTIRDNGATQPVTAFWRESDLPLTIGLVADISGSQLDQLKAHQNTLRQFLKQVLRPKDQAFLVSVDGAVRLIHDLTGQADMLADDVEALSPRAALGAPRLGLPCKPGRMESGMPRRSCGGSVIWNAVYWTARKMRDLEGRKAILLLTDGVDSGSDHGLSAAAREAQEADALVYTIGVKGVASRNRVLGIRMDKQSLNGEELNWLSLESGGRAFLDSKQKPERIFPQIEQELRNLYVLGFAPPPCDGQYHRLEVSAGPGLRARTRRGYFCGAPGSAGN
jgi:VWFA-related protein